MKASIARSRLRSAITSLHAELDTAKSFTDPDLTPAALTARQDAMRATATATHNAHLAELVQIAKQDAQALTEKADNAAAALPRDDVRSAQEWQHNILPQLEAGTNWDAILPNATIDGLHAVERFGLTWERMRAQKGDFTDRMALDSHLEGLRDAVRDSLWTHLPNQQVVVEAQSALAVAEVTSKVAGQLAHVRRSSDLSTASGYLNTVESPVFGGRFAADLAAETATE